MRYKTLQALASKSDTQPRILSMRACVNVSVLVSQTYLFVPLLHEPKATDLKAKKEGKKARERE